MFIIILINDIAVSISPEPNTFPKVNKIDKVGCLWNWKMLVILSNNDNKFWRLYMIWKEVLSKDIDLMNKEILFGYTLNSNFRTMQSTQKYFQEESKPFLQGIVFQLSISMLNISKCHYVLNHACRKVKQVFYFGILAA